MYRADKNKPVHQYIRLAFGGGVDFSVKGR
jgi:hypothetical protein